MVERWFGQMKMHDHLANPVWVLGGQVNKCPREESRALDRKTVRA